MMRCYPFILLMACSQELSDDSAERDTDTSRDTEVDTEVEVDTDTDSDTDIDTELVCAEDLDVCDDACVDLDLEEAHCGACGSPCGGTCIDGVCEDSPAGMAFVPPFTADIGSPTDEPGRDFDEQQTRVTIGRGLYVSQTEVTQRQWLDLMGNNPSEWIGSGELPVDSVNWYSALAYANAKSIADGLFPCFNLSACTGSPGEAWFSCPADIEFEPLCDGYRLPTEAEWEVFARAGSPHARHGDVAEVAWTAADDVVGSQPVATKQSNDWNLYDTLGNVAEWTWDWYGTYPSGSLLNPRGPDFGIQRVARGGSVERSVDEARAARRIPLDPMTASPDVGFRLVRNAVPLEVGGQLDGFADLDGDGLTNAEETNGWLVLVDHGFWPFNGVPGLEQRTVRSNPFVADSDGDGLSDAEELAHRLDPMLADTDGDTLSDYDEITRWGTSGSSVDTDGDSRGPDGAYPPVSALFDGAELRLMEDPANPGWFIPGVNASSPTDDDTDGDGLHDYDELGDPLRHIAIAEMPSLDLDITPGATWDLYLDVTYEDSQGRSSRYGSVSERTEELTTEVGAEANVWAAGRIWSETELSASAEGGFSTDIFKAKGEVKETIGIEVSFGGSLTTRVSEAYTEGVRNEWSREKETSRTRTETFSEGVMRVPFDLENNGRISYTLEGLEIVVMHFDYYGNYVPLATLEPEGTDSFSLAPGQRTTVLFSANDINPDRVRGAMAFPSGMQFLPASFRLQDGAGEDFVFQLERALTRNAQVNTDFGHGDIELTAVAANIDRSASGAFNGIPLWQAFARTDLDVEVVQEFAPVLGRAVNTLSIEGTGVTFAPELGPDLNDPLPYEGTPPGERYTQQMWMAVIERDGGGPADFATDLLATRLLPGDTMTLVYDQDLDQDGIPSRIESIMRTSDDLIDTDGDGLSDYWEIRERRTIYVHGRPAYETASDPAKYDTDGDGLSDEFEFRVSLTDPANEDTDEDGYSDFDEFYEIQPLTNPDPLRPNPKALDIVLYEYNHDHFPGLYTISVVGVLVRNWDAPLVNVTVEWGDGVEENSRFPEPQAPGVFYTNKPISLVQDGGWWIFDALWLFRITNNAGDKDFRIVATDTAGRTCTMGFDYTVDHDLYFDVHDGPWVECDLNVNP